jgi:hypothetical protein
VTSPGNMRVINRVAALKVGAKTTWLLLPAAGNRLALRRHNPAIACRLKVQGPEVPFKYFEKNGYI